MLAQEVIKFQIKNRPLSNAVVSSLFSDSLYKKILLLHNRNRLFLKNYVPNILCKYKNKRTKLEQNTVKKVIIRMLLNKQKRVRSTGVKIESRWRERFTRKVS